MTRTQWSWLTLVGVCVMIGSALAVTGFTNAFTPQAATADSGLQCVDANGDGILDLDEVFRVVDAYFDGTEIIPKTPPTPTPTPAPSEGDTRSLAYPYGERFPVGIFDLQIIAIDTDAWPKIWAHNRYNDPPAEGKRFVMWTLDVENTRGSFDEYEWFGWTEFELVGSKNVHYSMWDNSCGSIPGNFNAGLYKGGAVTGNICFSVPEDETDFTFRYDAYRLLPDGDYQSGTVWFHGWPE